MSMRPTMRNLRDKPAEIDFVSKWILAILAIVGLLTAVYLIIHYAAQIREAEAQLKANLPANYSETIKAMMASTGNPCRDVCGIDAVAVGRETAALRVSCSTGQLADPCALTHAYTFTIAPAPEASR